VYVGNNPVNYTDPTGHTPCVASEEDTPCVKQGATSASSGTSPAAPTGAALLLGTLAALGPAVSDTDQTKKTVGLALLAVLGGVLTRTLTTTITETLTPKPRVILYHYTDEAGFEGILKSNQILPSVGAKGDAVYGTGVYLTSVVPGTGTREGLAYGLFGNSSRGIAKTQYYFAIDVTDLPVTNVNGYVYLRPGLEPLVLGNRLLYYGVNPAPVDK
jgi:hypothetical protein